MSTINTIHLEGHLKKDAGSKLSQLYIYVLEGLMTASHEHAQIWFALAKACWITFILAKTGIFKINTAYFQVLSYRE